VKLSRPGSARPRRPFFGTIAGQRLLRQSAVVLVAFLAGYLVSVFWLFPAPLRPKDRLVPRVLDLGATEAKTRIEGEGFRFAVQDRQPDPSVPQGAVIWQDPPAGVVAPPNTPVSLILSEGPPDVVVPDVAGFPRGLAEKVLKAAGFKVGNDDTIPATSEPGTVVQTRPAPGVGRVAGTTIGLVISSGPAEFVVPALVGLPVAEARTLLQNTGLAVGMIRRRARPGTVEGVVLEQQPAAGARSPKGGRVDLIVSRPEP
jgi:beta-lactam-binding protein with PASTA domain